MIPGWAPGSDLLVTPHPLKPTGFEGIDRLFGLGVSYRPNPEQSVHHIVEVRRYDRANRRQFLRTPMRNRSHIVRDWLDRHDSSVFDELRGLSTLSGRRFSCRHNRKSFSQRGSVGQETFQSQCWHTPSDYSVLVVTWMIPGVLPVPRQARVSVERFHRFE